MNKLQLPQAVCEDADNVVSKSLVTSVLGVATLKAFQFSHKAVGISSADASLCHVPKCVIHYASCGIFSLMQKSRHSRCASQEWLQCSLVQQHTLCCSKADRRSPLTWTWCMHCATIEFSIGGVSGECEKLSPAGESIRPVGEWAWYYGGGLAFGSLGTPCSLLGFTLGASSPCIVLQSFALTRP